MKKILILFISLFAVNAIADAQNISNLETSPTFKGITIGMPVSKISNIIRYTNTVDGKKVYTVTDSRYNSVFGTPMDYVNVISNQDLVYAIIAVKDVRGNVVMFDTSELENIKSGLSSHFGNPTKYLSDGSHFSFQWISQTKKAIDELVFYGTTIGYRLLFILSENEEDF